MEGERELYCWQTLFFISLNDFSFPIFPFGTIIFIWLLGKGGEEEEGKKDINEAHPFFNAIAGTLIVINWTYATSIDAYYSPVSLETLKGTVNS